MNYYPEMEPFNPATAKKSIIKYVITLAVCILIVLVFAFIAARTDQKYAKEMVAHKDTTQKFTDFVNLVFNSAAQTGTNTNDFLIIRGIKFKRIIE